MKPEMATYDTRVVMVVRNGVLMVYQELSSSVMVVVDAKLQLGLKPFTAATTLAMTATIVTLIISNEDQDDYQWTIKASIKLRYD